MLYSKKKDCKPEETIKKISSILNDIGLNHSFQINESSSDNKESNLHSCRILVNDIAVSNGKGTNKIYSLASGYAELMERLQNCRFDGISPFNVFSDIIEFDVSEFLYNKNYKKSKDFLINLDINSFAKKNIKEEDYNNIFFKWLKSKTKVRCFNFYDVFRKTEVILPYELSIIYTASNGMSSGNTPQEALVQGISEIIERYVQKEILKNNFVCPIIPKDFYEKYSIINKIIEEYKELGFQIQIRDASLGKGFPVVCVILIDTKNCRHAVNFGAHPIFPIAVERVLTELAQGVNKRNLNSFSSSFFMSNFNLNEDIYHKNSEILQLFFKNAKRIFPLSFYSENFSWKFNINTWQEDIKENKELLKYYISLISELGYDLYIKDFSFLNFPTFYTVIPQMSSIIPNRDFDIDNTFSLNLDYKYKANKLLLPLSNAIRNKHFEFAISYLTFLQKIYLYDKTRKILFIELFVLQQYLKFQIEGLKQQQIYYYMEFFYGKNLTERVINNWINTDNPEIYWEITEEDIRIEKQYKKIEEILKKEYKPISLENLKKIL